MSDEDDKVLSKKEVLAILGVTNVTLWSWIRAGKFPAARVLGMGEGQGWLSTEVEAALLNAPPDAYFRRLNEAVMAHPEHMENDVLMEALMVELLKLAHYTRTSYLNMLKDLLHMMTTRGTMTGKMREDFPDSLAEQFMADMPDALRQLLDAWEAER